MDKASASSVDVSARMRAQREHDTAIERSIRRLLWNRGFRYRVHYRIIRGLRREADIAFVGKKVAVFIDGCFWHGCEEHRSIPKANREWWMEKIATNRARDRDTDRRLADLGWSVVRVWEHESPSDAAEKIVHTLRCDT